MTSERTPVDKMGTIEHAVFVERSTNPDCPIVAVINEALKEGDIDFAYEIAIDCLTPKKSVWTKAKEFFQGKSHNQNSSS